MNKTLKLISGVCLLILISCNSYYLVNKAGSENIELNNSLPVNASEYEKEIKPYRDSISTSMDEVLNISDVEMIIGIPEGNLGNFTADLTLYIGNKYYEEAFAKQADFALLNNGGLRTSLPKGYITRRKLFELMPFENQLVAITLTKEKVIELFNFIADKTDTLLSVKKGVPLSGNVKLVVNDKMAKYIYINGQKLVKESYTIITSDYLSNGGDKMNFFLNPVKTENLGVKLRDAIIEYVVLEKQNNRNLTAKKDKRISYATK
jgi:2',3'-cyclic-nucleotide 2'-phosphodiesterase (5'-nucleotidase family)